MKILIFTSFVFIIYTYAGYPLILWLWSIIKGGTAVYPEYFPPITVIIAAYNEEESIAKTLDSILKSDYPKELMELVVVSDVSTDKTDEIVTSYGAERVRLIRVSQRSGKKRAISRILPDIKNEILLVADANSIFLPGTVKTIVRHFSDPKVGSSVAKKTIVKSGTSVAKSDGVYWLYESRLRYFETLTGSSCVGVEGGLFAVRKSAFVLDFPDDLSSDYSIFCNVFMKGYANHYDPEAIVYEEAAKDIKHEFDRKIRVIVRGIRAFFAFWYLLNPFKNPLFFFQNISHRLCRWLVPFFLIAIFIGSMQSADTAMRSLFYLQVIFYGLSLLGMALKHNKVSSAHIFSIPAYFVSMNAAALVSWFLVFRKYKVWTARSA